jgi:hypothetical protein
MKEVKSGTLAARRDYDRSARTKSILKMPDIFTGLAIPLSLPTYTSLLLPRSKNKPPYLSSAIYSS